MLLTLIWLAIFFKGIEYPEFATSYTTYKVKKKENISRKQAKTIYCLKEILTNQPNRTSNKAKDCTNICVRADILI